MESMIYEQQAHEQGFALVCGVDEAGAGPLMGPLYAAAVILPEQFDLPGLNDSKKLTEKKREALFPLIQQQAVAWAVASVSAREIDETDILSARMRAMQLAIDGLSVRPELALIDGNRGSRPHGGHRDAPPVHRGRRRAVGLYRRRVYSGQGQPGSVRLRCIGQAVSGISICKAQGLRNQAALRDAGSVRRLPGAPHQLSEKLVCAEEVTGSGRGTKGRSR